jgi:hypothetical protein
MRYDINITPNIKLNVKPVKINLCHKYVYEGPCRFEKGENLKQEHDLQINAERFKSFVDKVIANFSEEDANILEPVHIQVDESFLVDEKHLAEIGRDYQDVDVYIVEPAVGNTFLEFAQKYRKPIISIYDSMTTAAFQARGLEVHPCETWVEAAEIVKVLRVKKALAATRVLTLVRMNSTIAPGMLDSFICLEDVTARLGTRFVNYNIHEFMDQTHNVAAGSNITTPASTNQYYR